jgi:hypothetical protein
MNCYRVDSHSTGRGKTVPEHTTDRSAGDETPPTDAISEGQMAAEDFDQELGEQMGKDAQRFAEGEMGEEEFYEKYHEALVEEFGADNRPVAQRRNDS